MNPDNKLIFLGTAGDSTLVSKQMRASGGIVLIYNNNQFHLDPGPGSLLQYKINKLNPRNTIGLIVTNNLLSHCSDTNAVISAMTHNGLDNRGVLVASSSVLKGTEDENPIMWKRYQTFLERNITLNPDERVGINEIDFKAIPTRSKDKTGIGLKITTPNFKITYTSSTRYNSAITRYYEDTDILIINTQYPFSDEPTDNMNCNDVIKIIQETMPNLVILTGFGIKMLNSDPIFVAREIQRNTGVQVISAHDGFNIIPDTYAKQVKKRLSDF